MPITVYFITAHGPGPAGHFASFAEDLRSKDYEVRCYASQAPALEAPFKQKSIIIDIFAKYAWEGIIDKIAQDSLSHRVVVITDVGDGTMDSLHQILHSNYPSVSRGVYYDNPEKIVPGLYLDHVASMAKIEETLFLFANQNLKTETFVLSSGEKIVISSDAKVGLGYYPMASVKELIERRENELMTKRAALLAHYGIEDTQQRVIAYIGGNNPTYFTEAFPAFLHVLEEAMAIRDLSNFVIVLQQHPGAKKENTDGYLLKQWIEKHQDNSSAPLLIVSDWPTSEIEVVAQGVFYHQTTMAPKLLLGGIPLMQIGKEKYVDVLTKQNLIPFVSTGQAFVEEIEQFCTQKILSEEQKKHIEEGMGISPNWSAKLEAFIRGEKS